MLTLRFTQHTVSPPDEHRVEVSLEGDNLPRQTSTASIRFALSAQDQEKIRWYLEDYLKYPFDPAPTIAASIEKHMAQIGANLFKAIFRSEDARELWSTLRTKLNDARVEVVTGVQEATTIPWELIRDPKTDTPLALRSKAFVRAHPQPVQRPDLPKSDSVLRILLVICRPGGSEDVPFRSVASQIIKGLEEDTRESFDLDVLRPPTFEHLAEVLRAAKAREKSYHIVHFDGHGAFLNMQNLFKEWKDEAPEEMMRLLAELVNIDPIRFSPNIIYPGTRREGKHGYLAFENPESEYNFRFVDGPDLGKLLVETEVPVLLLNACRSAHAEAPETEIPEAPKSVEKTAETDVHAQVRALGSFAQEVMDAGVAGVVAMRYNVYVVTAAQFVANLYAALTQGHTLGEAVTLGRKQLNDQPLRTIACDPLPLQDWSVPVVYEAAPIAFLPKPKGGMAFNIRLKAGDSTPKRGEIDRSLPHKPDVGFFGRDETLLALDRAFDKQPVVLLHAYAGSGKTACASEFARWYSLTGGIEGKVLFTSFEQYKPLARVLDQLGHRFEPMLEERGIHWLTLSENQRRAEALKLLKKVPVLWVWDNVESVMDFPAGKESAWSEVEQQELANFLRTAREARAKFLLTSRRDEHAWLGELPARITLPPMPMLERIQLARALSEKYGHRLSELKDWRTLLCFTQGNPLTIAVVVGQALRDGLKTREQIEAFVVQLRSGEAKIEEEESEGKTKSLAASLNYGFEDAFNEKERKQLALLHFFQGFVDADVLRMMGDPNFSWFLPQVGGLTRDEAIRLLDRADEVGLLTALGDGYYTIHPALPWYFKSLFEQYYSSQKMGKKLGEGELTVTRSFVEGIALMGSAHSILYYEGKRNVISLLAAEEANLLHARELAHKHSWWHALIYTMQGLRVLYYEKGRWAEWDRLVSEIVPEFIDPATDGPLHGREKGWSFISELRADLAIKARQLAVAENLQRKCLEYYRQRATPALAVPLETLDRDQRNSIHDLAASLGQMAEIQIELLQPECVTTLREALTLTEKIGDKSGAAAISFNLGRAYQEISAIRDLDHAERWYWRSFELRDAHDTLGHSNAIDQIGVIFTERFKEARKASAPKGQLIEYANKAIQSLLQALSLLKPHDVDELGILHEHLGHIYAWIEDFDLALSYFYESIRYYEAGKNIYSAARTRTLVAVTLADAGRLAEASEYARAALRDFQTFGDREALAVQEIQHLIGNIDKAMENHKS